MSANFVYLIESIISNKQMDSKELKKYTIILSGTNEKLSDINSYEENFDFKVLNVTQEQIKQK